MDKKTALKFLIPEPPLQVLPSLAQTIGLNEAIVLQQIHYWLSKSTHTKENFNWIYNTYKEWLEQFPFWSESTIKRIFSNLEEGGLVISKMFGKGKGDRTKWYRIDYGVVDLTEENTPPIVSTWPDDNVKLTPSIIETENNYRDIYTQILENWNSHSITVHRTLTDKIKRSINGRLKEKYTVDEICTAIDNYAKILQGDLYFWNYKWTLQDFMQRGFDKFIHWDTAHNNYLKDKGQEEREKLPDGDYFNSETKKHEFWSGGKVVKVCENDEEYFAELRARGENVVVLPKIKEGEYTFQPPTYEEIQEQIKKGERKVWDF